MAAGQGQSLGPAPILTPPTTWLGLLQIKQGGQQPKSVAPFVQPIIEMTRFYLAGARSVLADGVVQAAATNLPTNTNAITVPSGKYWLIDSITATSGAQGAAPASDGAIFITGPGNRLIHVSAPSAPGATGKVLYTSWEGPTILDPGSVIRVFTSAVAAVTAFNWTVTVIGAEVLG